MTTMPPRTLRDFIVSDFRKAWDAMALADFDPGVGGNFMFARQAMVLLELASRVASRDEELLGAFAAELERVQPLYFTPMRGAEVKPEKHFRLPYAKGRPEPQLLAVLFDLVRNGQMHYGEQIHVRLGDGALFGIRLGGVWRGATLDRLPRRAGEWPVTHLAFRKRADGDLELWVLPGVLLLDIDEAADRAGVFGADATLEPFERRWAATSGEIEAAIRETSHPLFEQDGTLAHPSA